MENEKVKEPGNKGEIRVLSAKHLAPKAQNYDFAHAFAPDVVGILNLADDYLYFIKDPQGSIMKVGAATELLVQHIAIKENLNLPPEKSAYLQDAIEYLEKKSSCPGKIIKNMDYIRKRRNEANHENKAKEYDAKVCLKNAYKILCWCIENYRLGTPTEYIDYSNFISQQINFRQTINSLLSRADVLPSYKSLRHQN